MDVSPHPERQSSDDLTERTEPDLQPIPSNLNTTKSLSDHQIFETKLPKQKQSISSHSGEGQLQEDDLRNAQNYQSRSDMPDNNSSRDVMFELNQFPVPPNNPATEPLPESIPANFPSNPRNPKTDPIETRLQSAEPTLTKSKTTIWNDLISEPDRKKLAEDSNQPYLQTMEQELLYIPMDQFSQLCCQMPQNDPEPSSKTNKNCLQNYPKRFLANYADFNIWNREKLMFVNGTVDLTIANMVLLANIIIFLIVSYFNIGKDESCTVRIIGGEILKTFAVWIFLWRFSIFFGVLAVDTSGVCKVWVMGVALLMAVLETCWHGWGDESPS
jgi:hypothetical protein